MLNPPREKGRTAFIKEMSAKNIIIQYFIKIWLIITNKYLFINKRTSVNSGFKEGDIIHIFGSTFPEYNGKFIVRFEE